MADLTEQQKYPVGINFREFDANRLGVGIQRDQFIEYLNSLPADSKGWINFDLHRNQNPELKRGYSHFLKLAIIKKREI